MEETSSQSFLKWFSPIQQLIKEIIYYRKHCISYDKPTRVDVISV